MTPDRVLIIDDHIGDITWLVDYLEDRGYGVDQDTNEVAARQRLALIKEGKAAYTLAIIDIMVSIMDIMEIVELDDDFYEESRNTGLRLCQYARNELGIHEKTLPIVCISAAADREDIKAGLDELKIRLFSRVPQAPEESIREYLERELPRIGSS